tara:strand:+ start:284 stop:457 length:174 start_codon:yes stop_codon:yes gene_type:complete
MTHTQQTFDNIPAPFKGVLLRALNIAIASLKTDVLEYDDADNAQLIESMQFIERKLR